MKPAINFTALCLTALLLLAGCGKGQENTAPASTPERSAEASDAASESLPLQEEPSTKDAPYVAGVPMYRGTVSEREEEGGHLLLKLESDEGVDFGYPSILMQTGADTKADFALDEIAVGDHLEVFYSDRNDGLPSMILSVTRLLSAADTVYNGEVIRYEQAESGSHMLELQPFGGGNSIIFHVGENTQVYLDQTALVPGARVNVYHRGALTRSIPPQGQALELRLYHEAAQ